MPKLIHVGRWHLRTKDDCHRGNIEKIFSDAWEEAQNPPDFLNYGVGVLTHLLCASPKGHDLMGRPIFDRDSATQEEATAAATTIQWLGSNVGFCWLCETLKKAGYEVRRIK